MIGSLVGLKLASDVGHIEVYSRVYRGLGFRVTEIRGHFKGNVGVI